MDARTIGDLGTRARSYYLETPTSSACVTKKIVRNASRARRSRVALCQPTDFELPHLRQQSKVSPVDVRVNSCFRFVFDFERAVLRCQCQCRRVSAAWDHPMAIE